MTDTSKPDGAPQDDADPRRAATTERGYYWARPTAREGRVRGKVWPQGEALAALRRGLGRDPGTVPEMWPYYTTLNADGKLTKALQAEHAALTLFGLHQQSQSKPMHQPGIGLGKAVHALRDKGEFSEEAVDRRFAATATATSMTELTLHLRGLITQLRGIGQPLDYTALAADLVAWQDPQRVGAVRRRWGAQYFLGRDDPEPTDPAAAADPEHRSTS